MSHSPGETVADEEIPLELPDQDAGAAFKTEMWIANTFLGYWKQLVAVVVVILVCALGYGEYNDFYRANQRQTSEQISRVLEDIPQDIPARDLSDEHRQAMIEAGTRLDEIGASSEGTSRIEAYLNAAEQYRIAGDKEKQRAALSAASNGASGALRYASEGALANLDLEEDQGDAAVERWRKMMNEMDGMLARRSAQDLGLALEHLERNDEAILVYTQFVKQWPNAKDVNEIKARKDRLSGGGS